MARILVVAAASPFQSRGKSHRAPLRVCGWNQSRHSWQCQTLPYPIATSKTFLMRQRPITSLPLVRGDPSLEATSRKSTTLLASNPLTLIPWNILIPPRFSVRWNRRIRHHLSLLPAFCRFYPHSLRIVTNTHQHVSPENKKHTKLFMLNRCYWGWRSWPFGHLKMAWPPI